MEATHRFNQASHQARFATSIAEFVQPTWKIILRTQQVHAAQEGAKPVVTFRI
jgi:hypothetical protein